jgi:ABC-type histidine transport system ATPase subunit
MAKKVIATLKTGSGKSFAKCIKMVKSPKSGAYIYKEEMVHVDHVKDYFAEN